MKSRENFVERRAHPRIGVIAQLEDITYSILRQNGVVSGPDRHATSAKPVQE
jgi:hypothetical protein